MRLFLFSIPLMTCWSAFAHDGHGQTGAHTHATDALGFVAAVVVVAAMIWAGRK